MSSAAISVDVFSSLCWWEGGSDGVLGERFSGELLVPARETVTVATDALQHSFLGRAA